MVSNNLPAGPKGQIQLSQNMVMLDIKLNGITNAATCKHILCSYTHPRSLWWGQRSNHFSESSLVAYQIRREWSIEHYASSYSVLTYTIKGKKNLNMVKLHIKLKGKKYKLT